ncbi:MAG: LPS export ABC transporter periplasmic protein LptC [Synergistaceae bacterium]|jgi:lipopolysaccharide assembly outer membrane protein LptD (OstA)|nr:LPS export ABC transporter periplasmic protein LptC [Synergistaceae bacterium]MBP9975012.1 LPS export ABC transporter periplasmic protein LptC [Synergistaceae bacterium]
MSGIKYYLRLLPAVAFFLFLPFQTTLSAAPVEGTMSADTINYNVNTKKISAVGNVIIKREGAILWGDKGEGNMETSEFTLQGNVKGTFPAEKTDLTADSVKWKGSKNSENDGIAEAVGKVHLTRGANEKIDADYVLWELGTKNYTAKGNVDAKTENNILIADEAGQSKDKFWGKKVKRYEDIKQKLVVSADTVNGTKVNEEINELVAVGNVVMDFVDKEGLKSKVTGEKGVYSKSKATFVISGNAKAVRSDGKTVLADSIIVHEDSNDIEAIGNSKITFITNEKKDNKEEKPKSGE